MNGNNAPRTQAMINCGCSGKKKKSCFGVNGLKEMNKKKLFLEEGSSVLGVEFSEPFRTSGNTLRHFCQGFFLRQNLV